jgi:preprotein translocase subunit SecG
MRIASGRYFKVKIAIGFVCVVVLVIIAVLLLHDDANDLTSGSAVDPDANICN